MTKYCNVHETKLTEYSTTSSSYCSGCIYINSYEAMNSNYPMYLKHPTGYYTCKTPHTYKKIHYYYCDICYNNSNVIVWYLTRYFYLFLNLIYDLSVFCCICILIYLLFSIIDIKYFIYFIIPIPFIMRLFV